jgi:hypothetical protein
MSKKDRNLKKSSSKTKEVKPISPPMLESTPIRFWKNSAGESKIQASKEMRDGLEALEKVVGVKDFELAKHILSTSGITIVSLPNQDLEYLLTVLAQTLNDLQPKDSIEARLIVQMAVVFTHAMDQLRMMNKAQHVPNMEVYNKCAVQLMNVHNQTIETLMRYRRNGEQKVIVQHINVNDSSKAVIGNINVTGGGGSV